MARPTVRERIAEMVEEKRRSHRGIRWSIALYLGLGLMWVLVPKKTDPEGIFGWTYLGMGLFMLLVHLRGERRARKAVLERPPV